MNSKVLVTYFSASGETERLAKTLAGVVHGDLAEIRPEVPYTPADLDWHDPESRSSVEMKDAASRPPMAQPINIDGYDTIFVGFPIWWYEAPRIIATFLESQDFSGKTVIPFATSGSSGMGNTDSILQKLTPAAHWKLGKRLNANAGSGEVSAWVDSLNI